MPQPLSLGVVDRMQALGAGRRKSAPSDKVDPDCQCLPGGIEVDASHVPRFGNAESGFKQLVLHSRALGIAAQIAEHDDNLAAMAFEDLLVALRDNQLGQLRREEPLQSPDPA